MINPINLLKPYLETALVNGQHLLEKINPANFSTHNQNRLRAFISIFALGVISAGIGTLFGGIDSFYTTFAATIGLQATATFFARPLVFLIQWVHTLKPEETVEGINIHEIVDELYEEMGLQDYKRPKLGYVNNHIPNAFATGRNMNNAGIAVTTGIIKHAKAYASNNPTLADGTVITARDLIKTILVHEITHVRNGDILTNSVSGIASSLIDTLNNAWYAKILNQHDDETDNRRNRDVTWASRNVLILSSYMVSGLSKMLQMMVSRACELNADIATVDHGCSEIMEHALRMLKDRNATQNAGHDHMHQFSNALFCFSHFDGGVRMTENSEPSMFEKVYELFSTHPLIDNRINALRNERAKRAQQAAETSAPSSTPSPILSV